MKPAAWKDQKRQNCAFFWCEEKYAKLGMLSNFWKQVFLVCLLLFLIWHFLFRPQSTQQCCGKEKQKRTHQQSKNWIRKTSRSKGKIRPIINGDGLCVTSKSRFFVQGRAGKRTGLNYNTTLPRKRPVFAHLLRWLAANFMVLC